MYPSIVFLDESTLGDVDNLNMLKEAGNYRAYKLTLPEQRIEHIGDAEIIITNKVLIDKYVMDSCQQLKLVCISATGMNNVDLEYAEKKGIQVKNVAGYSTESVAQAAFSMLFFLLHQSNYYNNYVESGEYCNSPIFTHYGPSFWELKGKTFGIVGLGTIGRRVAELAEAFGCSVVYHSTSGKNLNAGYTQLPLDELLKLSDVVSIHCPLNDSTLNLLGAEQLGFMKPSAILLNLGRGGIVNEAALADAIDSNVIGGAAVDVLTREPVLPENPLLNVKNKSKLFITPHNAWASMESRRLLVEKLSANIKNYLSGN